MYPYIPQLHVLQSAFLQRQGTSGCGPRHWHPLHVCVQDRPARSIGSECSSISGYAVKIVKGDHHQERGGRGGAACGESGHHYQRVDG